jgi:hypothetical protein
VTRQLFFANREAVFEAIKEQEEEPLESFIEPSDLVLSTSSGAPLPEMGDLVDESIVVSLRTTITAQFKYHDRTFSHNFERSATVTDGLEFSLVKFIILAIKVEPEAMVLLRG